VIVGPTGVAKSFLLGISTGLLGTPARDRFSA
jgi:hypothetical protein